MRRPGVRSILLAIAVSSAAAAQPAEDTHRATARQLGDEGVALYQRGDYEAALDRLDRAQALVPVPTLALWAARSLVKLGRWVEAHERYSAAERMDIPDRASEVHAQARQDARRERSELWPRIPKLTLEIRGADPAEVRVQVNERDIASALLGVAQPLDPGSHRVVATRGDERIEKTVELQAGARETLTLEFRGGPLAPVARPAPAAPAARSRPTADVGHDPGPAAGRSGPPPLAIAAYVVSGAGLIVGNVTGLMALQKKSELDADCPDRQCGPAFHDDVDSYSRLTTISSLGFVTCAVGAAAGTVLWLTADDGQASVGVRFSPGAFGVEGSF